MRKILIGGLTGAAALAMGASAAYADGHCSTTPSGMPEMPDLSGEVVTITGPWEGRDEELVNMVLSCFESATGADVQYSGSGEFEQLIVTSIRAGNAPNVAIFPQPGLAADMAAEGGLDALGPDLAAWMTDNYGAGSSWVDLGTYADENGADQFYAFAYKVDVKSLVWYSPEGFEDNGYEIPGTMEELVALSD
ncbi:MAG: alpha-glucoside ABC transporter substrate-binding protein, partial [Geminicoccus sp.]|nr:alpha-glucoside ABC transporter substrate-binding protein [Geminicoccus sp.]